MIMADYDYTLSTAFMPKSLAAQRNERLQEMQSYGEGNSN